MASLMTKSVILFCCWALIATAQADVESFQAVYSGRFDNEDNRGFGPLVQLRLETVSVPALDGPVTYLEEAVDGEVVLRFICLVTQLTEQVGVRLTVYNAERITASKFGEFNTADLAGFTDKDFQPYPGCLSDYILVSKVYVGTWTNCLGGDNENQPKFLVTVDKDSFDFITTTSELNLKSYEVYHLNRL